MHRKQYAIKNIWYINVVPCMFFFPFTLLHVLHFKQVLESDWLSIYLRLVTRRNWSSAPDY